MAVGAKHDWHTLVLTGVEHVPATTMMLDVDED